MGLNNKLGHKLNKEEKLRCIDFLFLYEQEINKRYGHYDFNSPQLERFCKENDVLKKGKRNCKTRYFFWFDTKTGTSDKGKINDIAHHLLRHIRNAIAHGNIKKENKILKLYDYNTTSKQTMQAHLPINFLWKYIDILINTYEQ